MDAPKRIFIHRAYGARLSGSWAEGPWKTGENVEYIRADLVPALPEQPETTPRECGTCVHEDRPANEYPCNLCREESGWAPKQQDTERDCATCSSYGVTDRAVPCEKCYNAGGYTGWTPRQPDTCEQCDTLKTDADFWRGQCRDARSRSNAECVGVRLSDGMQVRGVLVRSVNDRAYLIHGATEDAVNTPNEVDFIYSEVDPLTIKSGRE